MFAPPVPKPMPRQCALPRRVEGAQPQACPGSASEHRGQGTRPDGTAFGTVPLLASRRPIQAKLEIGAVDDPLEHEADRRAAQVMGMPEPEAGATGPSLRAGTGSEAPEWGRTAPAPDSFSGRGEKLPAPVRGFFEPRFARDFGGVRVHRGPDAAASARSLGARAYTCGPDIVFGAGQYSPGSGAGRHLLAHELAHVVQQGEGRRLVQRSPLSDSVKDAFTADPRIEALLTRLSQADVQAAQADTDVDAEIARLLAGRTDDLALAQQIRTGELGKTTGALGPMSAGNPVPRPIKAFFFAGSTNRRALVIAGVHGTERQGIEVAERLIKDLQAAKQQPAFTTIIVPSLFPDNAAKGALGERESGSTKTNSNFPLPTEDLAAAKAAGGGTAVDATKQGGKRTRAILPENVMLLELMERFHPERIISIHGTWRAGAAGVFYDRRSLTDAEVKDARAWAGGMAYMQIPPERQDAPGGQEELRALEEQLFQQRLAQLSGQTEQADRDLSLAAATQIDSATAGIAGRDKRAMIREDEPAPPTGAVKKARQAHPSVAGNIGPTGAIDRATWTGTGTSAVSLGEYAPPRGMSVFTVEPPVNRNSADYPTGVDQVDQAGRITELQAYADAVRTILLGKP